MSQDRTTGGWLVDLVNRFASSEVGSWLLLRTLPPLDGFLPWVSGGRLSLASVLSALGIPVVRLTTTGAKTGKERSVPVRGMRDGDRWVVIASNFGREGHPAWYHNLRANPEVKLTHGCRTKRYVAREATGDEREKYWNLATDSYPGYERYQARAGDRRIPVVVLTPMDDRAGAPDG